MLVQPTAFCVGLKQKRQSVQGLRSFTHALTQTHHAMKIEQIDCGAHHSLTANSLCSGEVQEQAVTHIQPVDPYTQPKCFLSVFCFSCFFVLVVWWHPPPPVWPLGLFADGCLSPGTNSTPPPLLNPTIKTMHIETHTYPSTKTFFSPFVRLLCLCTNKTQNIAARLNQQANTVGHLPHTSNHHSCVRVFVCVCVRVCVCACVGVWVCVCSLPSSPSFLPPFSFFFFFLVLHFAIFFFPFLCVRLHSMSRSREYTTTVPLPVPSSLRCCLGHASSARRCLSWFLLVGIFFLSLLVSALSVVQPDVQVSPPLSPVLSLFASFLLFVFSCFHLFFLLACLVSSLPSSQSPPPPHHFLCALACFPSFATTSLSTHKLPLSVLPVWYIFPAACNHSPPSTSHHLHLHSALRRLPLQVSTTKHRRTHSSSSPHGQAVTFFFWLL